MKKLFENITKISVGTWVRGILSLVSIVNMAPVSYTHLTLPTNSLV